MGIRGIQVAIARRGGGGGICQRHHHQRRGGGIRASFQFGRTGCVSTNFFPSAFVPAARLSAVAKCLSALLQLQALINARKTMQGALSTAHKKNVQPEEFSGQLSLGESSFFFYISIWACSESFSIEFGNLTAHSLCCNVHCIPQKKTYGGKNFREERCVKLTKLREL